MDHATRAAPPLSVCLWSWDDKVKPEPKLEWLQQYCNVSTSHTLENIVEFYTADSITKQALDTFLQDRSEKLNYEYAKNHLLSMLKFNQYVYQRVLSELLSGQDFINSFKKEKKPKVFHLGDGVILLQETVVVKETLHQKIWAIEYLYKGHYDIRYDITLCNDIDLYFPSKVLDLVNRDIVILYGKYYHIETFYNGTSCDTVMDIKQDCDVNVLGAHKLNKLENYLNEKINSTLRRYRVNKCLGSFRIEIVADYDALVYQVICTTAPLD